MAKAKKSAATAALADVAAALPNLAAFAANTPSGKDYIVRQLPETVYEVPFESPAHAALVAWKTGNLHLPAQIFDGFLRVLHDEAMKSLLDREGWAYTEPTVLFQPLKAMAHA